MGAGDLILPTVDFAAYYRESEAWAKVQPASAYLAELLETMRPSDRRPDPGLPWRAADRLAFRPGEVSLWVGINGHGKSQIVGQAQLGWANAGERICVASFEMRPVRLLQRLLRQAAKGNQPTEDFAGRLVDWLTGRLWFYDQQGTVTPDAVFGVIRYCADKLGCTQFVIDSLMKCVKGEEDYDGQKQFVDSITALARDLNVHVHLVHHVRKGRDEDAPPNKFDAKGAGAITDQVDNVLIVWRNKRKERLVQAGEVAGDGPDGMLICEKQRNGEWEGRIGLWFHKGAMQYTDSPKCYPLNMTPLTV